MLAQAYRDEHRDADCIKLLESTPYFVNWEGQDLPWRLYNQAHLERGRGLLDHGHAQAALADFEAALRYPANLNVGRPDKPEEAPPNTGAGRPSARSAAAAKPAPPGRPAPTSPDRRTSIARSAAKRWAKAIPLRRKPTDDPRLRNPRLTRTSRDSSIVIGFKNSRKGAKTQRRTRPGQFQLWRLSLERCFSSTFLLASLRLCV